MSTRGAGTRGFAALPALRFARGVLRSCWSPAIRIGLSSTAAAASEAGLLLLVGMVAAALAAGDDVDTEVSFALWDGRVSLVALLVAALGCLAVRTVAAYDSQRVLARTVTGWEANARSGLLAAFLRADAGTQRRYRVGALQDLALADVEAGVTVLDAVLRMLPAALSFGLLLATAFVVSPAASGMILAGAAFLLLVLQPLSRRARSATERFTASRAAWAQELAQNQSLRDEIAVFGVVTWVERLSEGFLAAARRAHEAKIRLGSMVLVLYQSASYLIAVLLLLVFVVAGIDAANFAAVVLLLVRGLSYSQGLQHHLHIVEERSGIFERVEAAVDRLRAAEAPAGTVRGLAWEELTFAGVDFSYGSAPAVTGVDFCLRRGEMLGLIGPSGAGKSTLALLALGLLAPTRGSVAVDGVPIAEIARDERARRCAFVPQEAVLFELSVYDNVALGRTGIGEREVVDASTRAGVHAEIARLPHGYRTVADERGSRFSVGQRQRIAIARALAGSPRLVVFDEPTSALDPEAEAAVHRALDELRRDAALLVISHRRESALRCDRVLYVRDGRIVAEGPGSQMWELAGFGARDVAGVPDER